MARVHVVCVRNGHGFADIGRIDLIQYSMHALHTFAGVRAWLCVVVGSQCRRCPGTHIKISIVRMEVCNFTNNVVGCD